MAAFPGWERALLRAIGAPVTKSNLTFLSAWQRAEGGAAAYNPLNTTLGMAGAGSYNSAGVRSYGSAQQGILATKQSLLGDQRYTPILQGLKQGVDPVELANRVGKSPWGTSGATIEGALGVHGKASDVAMVKSMLAPTPSIPKPSGPDLEAVAAGGLQHLIAGNYDPSKALGSLFEAEQAAKQQPTTLGTQPQTPQIQIHGASKTSRRDQQAVGLVREYLGTPYVWGGTTPQGFDCSGLLQYVWGKLGVNIPRTTYDQWGAGKAVSKGALRPGDAVFFRGSDARGNLPGHVGMYIGGGRFIEAPHTGATVRISKLAGRSDYVGARRYA